MKPGCARKAHAGGGLTLALTVALGFAACRSSETPANVSPAEPRASALPSAVAIAADTPTPLDTSCAKDADCVPAPSCCPMPCTSLVINVKDSARAQKQLESSCPKDQTCPSAGGCVTHAYLCQSGHCALVFEGQPGYHAR